MGPSGDSNDKPTKCHNFHLLMLTLFCTMLAHMTEAGLRENQESSEVSIFQKILKLIKFSLSNLTILVIPEKFFSGQPSAHCTSASFTMQLFSPARPTHLLNSLKHLRKNLFNSCNSSQLSNTK